jgi:hypothetical protein
MFINFFFLSIFDRIFPTQRETSTKKHIPSAMADAPCTGCGKPMGTGDYEVALGKEYHVECFVCHYCKKPFPGGKFCQHEGHICHSACIPAAAAAPPRPETLCGKCRQPIPPGADCFNLKTTEPGDAGKVYHLNCIDCDDCKKPIGQAKYALTHGRPVHLGCMHGAQQTKGPAQEFAEGLQCSHCGELIRGQKKEVPGFGTYHLTCFKCCKCGLGIREQFFKDPDTGKARCHRCKP